jgi:hypothetical protein
LNTATIGTDCAGASRADATMSARRTMSLKARLLVMAPSKTATKVPVLRCVPSLAFVDAMVLERPPAFNGMVQINKIRCLDRL